jgi:arabinogalactan oligomer / maltooligosaccharide transport system permease protein
LSTTAASTQPPARLDARTAAWSWPSRLVAAFSGTPGLALKLAFLALVNAIAVWAAVILADRGKWPALGVLVATTAAIDAVYLQQRRAVAAKFLIPGTLLLLAFQVVPVAYTVNVAFTNYSTGHILTKSQAIDGIKDVSLAPPPNGQSYAMAPARNADGDLVLVLANSDTGAKYIGSPDGLEALPRDAVKVNPDGLVVSAPAGYTLVKGNELFTLDKQLQDYTIPTQGDSAIRPQGLDTALELQPTLRYDAAHDRFIRIKDGVVFDDNGRGSFVSASGEEIEPGWKTGIGFRNFDRLIHDKLVRSPFLRVFAWTFAFATLTVLLSFSLGLFLAITLDKAGMRFQRIYRAVLVIPYAIPGFLSLLVWRGLLNDDFGVINKLLHAHIAWLFGANMAKVSILLVSTWLTFPYFFLVAMGALQSIPQELTEAARVDGASAIQVFRKVTLPLLLVVVAPLMIASFAFNFNNFGNIYFLTGGGPAMNDSSVAGATDILISYTYKLAFAAGKGNDYGLASAVAIIIFFIVGTISMITFWRTKALENVR